MGHQIIPVPELETYATGLLLLLGGGLWLWKRKQQAEAGNLNMGQRARNWVEKKRRVCA
jgi:hypothetical protein